MTKEQLKQTRVQLYKATPLKLQLVDELIETFKAIPNRFEVEMTSITFVDKKLILNDNMAVKTIEIDPQEIGAILVHWFPNFNISTQSDPYCSIYMLSVNEIKKIHRRLKKIQEYAHAHS